MNLKNIMLIKSIKYKRAQTSSMCGSWQKTYLMYCKRNHISAGGGRRCMGERWWWWWTLCEKCFRSLKWPLLGEGLQNACIWQYLATFTLKMQHCYISCTQWRWLFKSCISLSSQFPHLGGTQRDEIDWEVILASATIKKTLSHNLVWHRKFSVSVSECVFVF